MNVRVDDLYLIFLVLYLMFRCIASDVFRVSMPAKFNSLFTRAYPVDFN